MTDQNRPQGSPSFSWRCLDCPAGGLAADFDALQRAADEHISKVHPLGGGARFGITDAEEAAINPGVSR